MVLFFLKLNNLKSNFVLAQFFCLNLLLSLQLLDQELSVIGLMINFLVSTFIFDPAQVDDVLSDAHANGHRLLEVRFHLNQLAIMMDSLKCELLLFKFLLLLLAVRPRYCELLNLSSVLFIHLVSEYSVLVSQVVNKLNFGVLTNALHLVHHFLSLHVVAINSVRQPICIQVLYEKGGRMSAGSNVVLSIVVLLLLVLVLM